jgi:hypothetical protein
MLFVDMHLQSTISVDIYHNICKDILNLAQSCLEYIREFILIDMPGCKSVLQ